MKKVYISGPISKIPFQEAFDNFEKKEKELIALGYEVVNPMKLEHNHDKSWKSYMKVDLKALIDCDCIVMLPGWVSSKGARIEWYLAKDLGIQIL